MAEVPQERPGRFYKTATAEAFEVGFSVLLDGRAVRTPRRSRLTLPTLALANLIAEEWAGQGESIVLAKMPATRLAFTASDHIAAARDVTVGEIVQFAGSDLLCYRAEAPAGLVDRQTRRWGAILDWAQTSLGLTFVQVAGIIHKPQPPETMARVAALAEAADNFALAGLALAAGLFGSSVLAFGVWRGQIDGDAAFELSRLDEAFQEEQWGVDDEAAARTAHHRIEAAMLGRWFQALQPSPTTES